MRGILFDLALIFFIGLVTCWVACRIPEMDKKLPMPRDLNWEKYQDPDFERHLREHQNNMNPNDSCYFIAYYKDCSNVDTSKYYLRFSYDFVDTPKVANKNYYFVVEHLCK